MGGLIGFFCSAASLYLAGSIGYLAYLFWEKGGLLRSARLLLGGAFLFHTLFLGGLTVVKGQLPMTSPFEAAGFFAWAIVAATFLSSVRYRIGILGAFSLPLVFLLVLSASALPKGALLQESFLRDGYFTLHTLFSFLGYAAFAMTSLTALMYLLLERQLKTKQVGRFFRRLPSLELLERLHGQSLGLGVFLFLVGIGFGLIWSQKVFGWILNRDLKALLAFATWGLYLALFAARSAGGLRGRRGMVASILLFGWVLILFFGIRHSFFFQTVS